MLGTTKILPIYKYAKTYGYMVAETPNYSTIVLDTGIGIRYYHGTKKLCWFVSTTQYELGTIEKTYDVETIPPPEVLIPILKKHLLDEICKEEINQKKWQLLFYNLFGNLEGISVTKRSFFEYLWNDKVVLISLNDYDVGFNFYITYVNKNNEKFYYASGERRVEEIDVIHKELVEWFNGLE